MTNMEIGIIVVTIMFILMIIVMYNMIISRMNRAKRAWSDVITYEKLKNDVVPQLYELSDKFKEFEADFVEKVTSMREAISELNTDSIDIKNLAKAEEFSKSIFSSMKATAESYPELGSTQLMRDLLAQVADKNENVAAAITIYNRGVEQFNNSIEMVPLNVVNGVFARKSKLLCFHHSNTVENYDYKPNFS